MGAAKNAATYDQLLYLKQTNYIEYGLTHYYDFGHYRNYFSGDFVFFGNDKNIIGVLDADATVKDIDDMFKASEASFYNLYLRKHPKNYLMNSESISIPLKELFRFPEESDIEFELIPSTNGTSMNFDISGGNINFYNAIEYGHSEFEITASLLNAEARVKTNFTVYNYIYPNIEDFEYSDLSGSEFSFVHGGSSPWEIENRDSFSGFRSLRSGKIDHEKSSEITLPVYLEFDGAVSFSYKTDTAISYFDGQISGDFLNFYINENNMSITEDSELWGGNNDWRVVSYKLPAGSHNLKWQYLKNDWGVSDNDAVWIDLIMFGENAVRSEISPKKTFELELSAYPNPFNPETTISFNLGKRENVKILLYDIKGNLAKNLLNAEMNSGYHSLIFNAQNLSAGMYFVVIETNDFTESKKIMFIK